VIVKPPKSIAEITDAELGAFADRIFDGMRSALPRPFAPSEVDSENRPI
jgi:hypothetical protein